MPEAATSRDRARDRVRDRLEQLLDAHDPAATDPVAFLGAQFDLGLAWVHFPEGLGGLGVEPHLQAVVDDRLVALEAPLAAKRNVIGHGMVAPSLVVHGSAAMQRRHLRPLFTGEEIWCQLFSEPGAGSDVASLATRAVRYGDEWVLDGQKVWTTLGHLARFGLLLARTDPGEPKHRGLTAFLLDMQAPGVEVRPLLQLTGHAEFNEIFLTGVRLADTARLGEVGAGWRVAVTTLMNERVAVGGRTPPKGTGGRIAEALALWRARATPDPARRDRLVRLWIEAEVLRLTNLRAQQMRLSGTPGPEGSLGKVLSARLNQGIGELTVDLLGASGMLKPTGYPMVRSDGRMRADQPVDVFLRTRASSIEGGTTEIAKNIIGERVLGLPGDVRVDKDLPWKEVRRS